MMLEGAAQKLYAGLGLKSRQLKAQVDVEPPLNVRIARACTYVCFS